MFGKYKKLEQRIAALEKRNEKARQAETNGQQGKQGIEELSEELYRLQGVRQASPKLCPE